MTDDAMPDLTGRIRAAQVRVPCSDLGTMLDFLATHLGFRVDMVMPADAPVLACVSGHGLQLRLQQDDAPQPVTLMLECSDDAGASDGAREWRGPDGLRIRLVQTATARAGTADSSGKMTISRDHADAWHVGRAGMHYRDLIPGRLGGRVIASHIHIPDGGRVPDYVHYHHVRLQIIYCRRGWVRLVYEDQGPPFTMHAGDCVLQPPHIRHRVLEASPGLEVIEIGSPAEHETFADHAMALPTGVTDTQRIFGGQRFTRHVASGAAWTPLDEAPGFEYRDTGIIHASAGLADVRVLRAQPGADRPSLSGQAARECHFAFVLEGCLSLHAPDEQTLQAGDAFTLPAANAYTLEAAAAETAWLQCTVPGRADPGMA